MSHFSVLVIGPNPEEQLAPYQENNMEDCPKKYLSFYDVEDEYADQYNNGVVEIYVLPTGKWEFSYSASEVMKKAGNLVKRKYSLLYETFEVFMCEYAGYEKNEDGRYGYYENPNAKWDWYQLGGRWAGSFKLKDNAKPLRATELSWASGPTKNGWCDAALVKDIDFKGMLKDAECEAGKKYDQVQREFGGVIPTLDHTWTDVLGTDEIGDINAKRTFYQKQPAKMRQQAIIEAASKEGRADELIIAWPLSFRLEDYQCTREEYIAKAGGEVLMSFAIVKDGEWHERGSMHWWGCVADEKDHDVWGEEFFDLIVGLPEDTELYMFDCHI